MDEQSRRIVLVWKHIAMVCDGLTTQRNRMRMLRRADEPGNAVDALFLEFAALFLFFAESHD